MQREIGVGVAILGVDGVGYEDDATFCAGRTIPWLQDVAEVDAWGAMEVDYRDVVVVDAEGIVVAYYNLTLHDLEQNSNYEELRDLLTGTAGL
jgi:hypothetical protein